MHGLGRWGTYCDLYLQRVFRPLIVSFAKAELLELSMGTVLA